MKVFLVEFFHPDLKLRYFYPSPTSLNPCKRFPVNRYTVSVDFVIFNGYRVHFAWTAFHYLPDYISFAELAGAVLVSCADLHLDQLTESESCLILNLVHWYEASPPFDNFGVFAVAELL